MRRIILRFLRALRKIERRYGQIADTDVREAIAEAIMEGFVEHREDYSLPPAFELLSERGDALVREAVDRFLHAANEEAERLRRAEPKNHFLLLWRAEVPRPERSGSFDDFLAGLDLSYAVLDESAWRAGDDPASMLDALRGRCIDRKPRLFAAASCGRIRPLLVDARIRRAVEALGRYADRDETAERLAMAARGARAAASGRCDGNDRHAAGAVAEAVWFADESDPVYGRDTELIIELHGTVGLAYAAVQAPADAAHRDEEGTNLACWAAVFKSERAAQVGLLRCIFGNPFRLAAIDPAWLTPDAVHLAQVMHENRAFDRMPELAGVFEEAECHDGDILARCRETGPHVRGCWAVDLILGKS